MGEGDSAVIAKATYTIAKADLTVTANNRVIQYGEAPPIIGVTYEGFVNGETESVLGGSLDFEYNYAKGNDVGELHHYPQGPEL